VTENRKSDSAIHLDRRLPACHSSPQSLFSRGKRPVHYSSDIICPLPSDHCTQHVLYNCIVHDHSPTESCMFPWCGSILLYVLPFCKDVFNLPLYLLKPDCSFHLEYLVRSNVKSIQLDLFTPLSSSEQSRNPVVRQNQRIPHCEECCCCTCHGQDTCFAWCASRPCKKSIRIPTSSQPLCTPYGDPRLSQAPPLPLQPHLPLLPCVSATALLHGASYTLSILHQVPDPLTYSGCG
jgi:hypothetical protein